MWCVNNESLQINSEERYINQTKHIGESYHKLYGVKMIQKYNQNIRFCKPAVKLHFEHSILKL